jgi:hypothetical protein
LRWLDPTTRVGRASRLAALITPLVLASTCGVSVCPWALVLRAPCPGCGMTRAALALAHGDIALAQTMNPSALLTVPIAAGLVAFFALSYLYDGRLRANARLPRALAVGTIVVLNAVWIARAFGAFGGPVPV